MKRLNRWDWLGVVAALAFAACLVFAYQHTRRASTNLAADIQDPSGDIRFGHEWMGLYYKDKRVGFFHIEKSASTQDGYRYQVDAHIQQKGFLGKKITLKLKMSALMDSNTILQSFDFSIKAGPADLSGRGVVHGKTLRLLLNTGGVERSQEIPLDSPPVLRETLGPTLSRHVLSPGKRLTLSVFDPMTQRNQPVTIEVVGPDTVTVVDQVVPATHIRQTLGGTTLNAWVNRRGEMLRQELGFGLVAIRETEAQATATTEAVSLGEAAMITTTGLPKSMAKMQTISLILSGKALSDFELTDRRQTFSKASGRLDIQLETVGKGRPLPVTDDLHAFLQPTPLIQSDAEPIKRTANEVIGDARDSVAAAKHLMKWVAEAVEDAPVIGVPSALETLRTRIGDCNEHATLFVALARAAHIPTRLVTGLVHIKGRFGYHAWAEISTEDGWVSVDPTWQQMPADVGHIAMVRGGLAAQSKLTRLMGNLKIKAYSLPKSP
jgi:hypothetical protein